MQPIDLETLVPLSKILCDRSAQKAQSPQATVTSSLIITLTYWSLYSRHMGAVIRFTQNDNNVR